jgi:hypothetical protein
LFSFVLFGGPQAIDRVRLEEDQTEGQRIIAYACEAKTAAGAWVPFSSGVTVGAKRIDIAAKPVM